jgi:hypothetical protein
MTQQKKERMRRKKINVEEEINNAIKSVENYGEEDDTKRVGMREEQTRGKKVSTKKETRKKGQKETNGPIMIED